MNPKYKKISEDEKEEIKKQAQKIIENFTKKLEIIKEKSLPDEIKKQESTRKETLKFPLDKNFKERILQNAKNKNKDFIIAEKKTW